MISKIESIFTTIPELVVWDFQTSQAAILVLATGNAILSEADSLAPHGTSLHYFKMMLAPDRLAADGWRVAG